jgi:signal transduction histidine kinase
MLTAHYLGNQFSPKEEPQRTKFEELIISLKSEVDQLNKVITDFLSIGKSSELTKTNFKFSDTMKQINILIKQQLTLKNINVHTTGDNDCFICADEGQMHLVLLNLFVNAIAAAPVNGDIWVHARKNDAPLSFILTITDNGPGIVPNDIDKIFEPYFTKTPGGTGLGLSLVKRIIEDHNGSIKAENCPGKGAQFSITLPIEK